MNDLKVLLIEDEKPIRRFLRINLEREGFIVYEASSGEEGLKLFSLHKPEIVLLDVMLPGIDGMEVCSQIRDESPLVVIIMLSAKGQEMDKIMGLELGADDYVVKPFVPSEVIARINAQCRKIRVLETNLRKSSLHLNKKHKVIYKNDVPLSLSPKEYDLFALLIENPLYAFSRDELLDRVWGNEFPGYMKTVDVHIRRLREKVEDEPSSPKMIQTVWGYGYRYVGE